MEEFCQCCCLSDMNQIAAPYCCCCEKTEIRMHAKNDQNYNNKDTKDPFCPRKCEVLLDQNCCNFLHKPQSFSGNLLWVRFSDFGKEWEWPLRLSQDQLQINRFDLILICSTSFMRIFESFNASTGSDANYTSEFSVVLFLLPVSKREISLSVLDDLEVKTHNMTIKKELNVQLGDVTEHNLQQLKILNITTLPVRYTDKFYRDLLMDSPPELIKFGKWSHVDFLVSAPILLFSICFSLLEWICWYFSIIVLLLISTRVF